MRRIQALLCVHFKNELFCIFCDLELLLQSSSSVWYVCMYVCMYVALDVRAASFRREKGILQAGLGGEEED